MSVRVLLTTVIAMGLFSRKRKEGAPSKSGDEDNFIRCPSCRKVMHSTLARCPYCSAFLEIRCPNCDRTTNRTFRECPYCSSPLDKQ